MKHRGQANREARQQLQGQLSVDVQDVERRRLFRAVYALELPYTHEQRRALADAAMNRKEPVGRVLGRVVDTPAPESGKNIEVLTGWDVLDAFIEENAYAPWVRITLIEANDDDAVFYAIQHAYEEAQAAGYAVTAIEYAEAVGRAREHFKESIPTLTRMATALRIGRPTLANRLALLDKLCFHLVDLTRNGKIPETAAKAIASLSTEQEQIRYAQAYLEDPVPIAELYARIQSGSPLGEGRAVPRKKAAAEQLPGEQAFTATMKAALGVPVALTPRADGDGRSELRLRYDSAEQLAALAAKLRQLMAGAEGVQGELVLDPETVSKLLTLTAPE